MTTRLSEERIFDIIEGNSTQDPCDGKWSTHTKDAIDQALGEQIALSQWVSVEDELPDFNIPVLGFCPIYGRGVRVFMQILDTKHGNWDDPVSQNKGGLPPTHWQPLPEKP